MGKRLMVVAGLLVVAALMVTMAYTSATVTSPIQASIVETNDALLALDCYEEGAFQDEICWIEDGILNLNFAAGFGDEEGEGSYGFQPWSRYVFKDVVFVTNNTNETVNVSVVVEGNTEQDDPWLDLAELVENGILTIQMQAQNGGTPPGIVVGRPNQVFQLGPNEWATLSFIFDTHEIPEGELSNGFAWSPDSWGVARLGNLVINAQQQ